MLFIVYESWHAQYMNVSLHVSCGFRADIRFQKKIIAMNKNSVTGQNDLRWKIKISIFLLEVPNCICFSRLLLCKCFNLGSCSSMTSREMGVFPPTLSYTEKLTVRRCCL